MDMQLALFGEATPHTPTRKRTRDDRPEQLALFAPGDATPAGQFPGQTSALDLLTAADLPEPLPEGTPVTVGRHRTPGRIYCTVMARDGGVWEYDVLTTERHPRTITAQPRDVYPAA